VLLVESYSQNSACVKESGNSADDSFRTDLSLGNQSFLLFSPWMLAVSDNFSWQVNATVSAGAAQLSLPILFASKGEKEIAGRRAFEISISSELGDSSTAYIDAEKRVLLLADFGNASARLVSAPFPLNWSSKQQ
jgi:hypothetical protein